MPTPDRTSLAQIVETAAALLESGGPAGVTMQAVATGVGVKAPSLYKRVRDRDALLALVADDAATDLAARLARTDGSLAAIARAYRAFARIRPEGFRLLFAPAGDEALLDRVSAPVLRAAREAVGDAAALDAARLLTAWGTGFITMELSGAFRLGGDIDAAFEYGLARIVSSLSP